MKTFYDLLDTDQDRDIDVLVDVRPITHNGVPHCEVMINDQCCYQGHLENHLQISKKLCLLETIDIEIRMSGKKYSQSSETAILIDHLIIDGFDLIPRCVHLSHYINDHGVDTMTSYLGYNGSWRIKIDRPFYQWKHIHTGQGWLLTPIIQ